MIEKTQRRLRQAQFFYRHLLNPRHWTKGDPEAFEFYFSAFIQAARSVTWTLGNEEPEKWEAWKQINAADCLQHQHRQRYGHPFLFITLKTRRESKRQPKYVGGTWTAWRRWSRASVRTIKLSDFACLGFLTLALFRAGDD